MDCHEHHAHAHSSSEHTCCGGHAHGDHHAHGDCCGHGGGCGNHPPQTIELTRQACDFLLTLAQIPFLPLARFLMTSTKSADLESVALAPVYLIDGTETVAQVRERGDMLLHLEELGLITLDYDEPLIGFDYGLYQHSASFHALEAVVQEGLQREDFLFDCPVLERGSIAPTALGQQAMEQLGHTPSLHPS